MKQNHETSNISNLPQQKNNIRVLLIEDEQHDALLVQNVLRSSPFASYNIEWKSCLASAFNFLENNAVDIILLDLYLEEHKGIDTFTLLHTNSRNIPIIVMSGISDVTLLMDIVEMGAMDYVLKDELTSSLLASSLLDRVVRYSLDKKNSTKQFHIQNAKRFQAVIENSEEAIALLDTDGVFQYVSPATERITGYSSKDLTSQHFWTIIHPEDKENVAETFRQLLYYPYAKVKFSFRGKHKDGSWIKINVSGHNLLKSTSVQAIIMNFKISKNTNHQNNLLFYEQLMLRVMMDGLPNAFYFKDTNSRFVFINPAYAQILGIPTVDDGIGKTDFDFLPVNYSAQSLADEQKILSTGEPIIGKAETIYREHEGQRWFSTTKIPVRNQDGEIIGIACSTLEITDLIQAKLKDQAKEQQIIDLSRNSSIPLLVYDTETYKFLDVNEAAIEQYGYSRNEFMNLTYLNLHDRNEQERLVTYSASQEQTLHGAGHWNHIKKDGSSFDVEVVARRIEYRGRTAFFAATQSINKKKNEYETISIPETVSFWGKETILIIEDELVLRDLIVTMLQDHGYNVLSASEGTEGVTLFEQHSNIIDLVITDLGLPKLDGSDVLRQIKSTSPGVKTMFTTGYLNDHMKQELFALDTTNFVLKPFNSIAFLKEVRNVLDARK